MSLHQLTKSPLAVATPARRPSRISIRARVMDDISVSAAARVLFFAIDDAAGEDGVCRWHWRKLAVRLGLGHTQIFEILGELRKAGHLSVVMEGRRALYLPVSRVVDNSVENIKSHFGKPESVTSENRNEPPYIYSPAFSLPVERAYGICACGKPTPLTDERQTCNNCYALFDPATAPVIENLLAWIAAYLHWQVKAWAVGFPKPPDAVIAAQCLSAAGEDVSALWAALRAITAGEYGRCSRSYAWFPKVIGSARVKRRM